MHSQLLGSSLNRQLISGCMTRAMHLASSINVHENYALHSYCLAPTVTDANKGMSSFPRSHMRCSIRRTYPRHGQFVPE